MMQPSGIDIFIDHQTHTSPLPSDTQLTQWATLVLKEHRKRVALSICLVDLAESATLNQQYRQKIGPTNILSFNFEAPPGVQSDTLGDIVLCPALITQEAFAIDNSLKTVEAHFAHLVIHGCLHLLDYHHHDETTTAIMQELEIRYLSSFGYPNPYQ